MQNLSFYYKGNKIDIKKNPKEFRVKLLILFAYNLKPINHDKTFDFILCPGCNDLATINIDSNNEVNIKCNKNHIYKELPLKEFLKKNDEFNKIENCNICGNCENLYGMPLYICSCGKMICPLCLLLHDPSHSSIKYNEKYSSCVLHGLPYITFCQKCNINICEKCEYDHKNHKMDYLKKYLPKISNIIIDDIEQIKKLCERINAEVERTQFIINKVINYYKKNLEGYSSLNDKLIKMLQFLKDNNNNIQNYETVKNIITIMSMTTEKY